MTTALKSRNGPILIASLPDRSAKSMRNVDSVSIERCEAIVSSPRSRAAAAKASDPETVPFWLGLTRTPSRCPARPSLASRSGLVDV